ncbi:MAG: glycosyltransferase family 2 protein [Thaumarchaeota archaeon]|nr:glycosyltransferase family 2 protein [Nitrososphaerota archaeon]
MPVSPFFQFVFDLFIISAVVITAYTCNFYYLAYLARHRNDTLPVADLGTPTVTIQLPFYNEKYVAKRLVDSVCAMDYPRDRMKIMVLDDSDDETADLLRDTVEYYRRQGFQIQYVRRDNRRGYKAGALKNAMKHTDTEFVAIFDADFMPPVWFLRKAIPYFSSTRIGLVQCRWGHANEEYSAMTRAQAMSLDLHFLVEQKAKSNSSLFMNFNGTAGIWRRECIDDAGGWHTATLVEDLDLSYRAQMKGWKCVFLPDVVVDAELPVQMNAAKRQQFRWAKGSIQCALKLLSDIVVRRGIDVGAKVQAFVQLTRHVVYPFMLIQFLTLPLLLTQGVNLYIIGFLPSVTLALYILMGPGAYLLILQDIYHDSWRQKAKILPFLLIYNAGMSVNNTVAVFDAVLGKKNVFHRTPKYGTLKSRSDWKENAYNLPFTRVTLLELFFAIYGVLGIMVALLEGFTVFAPIIAIQTIGYFYVTYLSLSHSKFKRHKSGASRTPLREEIMANRAYRAAMISIVAIITTGAFLAFQGYHTDIYPVDLARGHLSGIMGSSDPETIRVHLDEIEVHIASVMGNLPDNHNPVWLFPNPTTDFSRISGDLAIMQESLLVAESMPRDSTAYYVAMMDISSRALTLQKNLVEATPYMYVNLSNMLFATIWVAAILAIFAVLKKRRDKLTRFEQSGV